MFQIPMYAPGKIILQIEKIFSAGPQKMFLSRGPDIIRLNPPIRQDNHGTRLSMGFLMTVTGLFGPDGAERQRALAGKKSFIWGLRLYV